MPAIPAVPQNTVSTDQPSTASVLIEIGVSIVAMPWRRLVHAASWNGDQSPTTTGAARVSESHCQLVNSSTGAMAMAIGGTLSTSATIEPLPQ